MLRRTFLKLAGGLIGLVSAQASLAKLPAVPRFDSSALELPQGMEWGRRIDGMREVRQYDIALDVFMWRWDTIINGEQWNYCIFQKRFKEIPPAEFSELHRPRALKAFRERSAMRGRIAYFQNAA